MEQLVHPFHAEAHGLGAVHADPAAHFHRHPVAGPGIAVDIVGDAVEQEIGAVDQRGRRGDTDLRPDEGFGGVAGIGQRLARHDAQIFRQGRAGDAERAAGNAEREHRHGLRPIEPAVIVFEARRFEREQFFERKITVRRNLEALARQRIAPRALQAGDIPVVADFDIGGWHKEIAGVDDLP